MLLELLLSMLLAAPSSIVLRWKAVDGATLYDLQIASDPDFDDVVLSVRIASNGYRWEATPERTHYFRARGLDAEERAGPWSERKEIAPVFVAPAILKPVRGAVVAFDPNGTKINFEIEPSPLFASYRLEVASDERFSALLLDKTDTAAGLSFTAKAPGTYAFRLSAHDESGRQTAPGATGLVTVVFFGPEALGPELSEAMVGSAVELAWKACRGCASYRVQTSADPKWKTLSSDERTRQLRARFTRDAPGRVYWRVIGEDASGRRSSQSATKVVVVSARTPSSNTAVTKEREPSALRFFFGVGHALHWNGGAALAARARLEGGMAFALGPGRILAFLSVGLEHMNAASDVPRLSPKPDMLLVPATLIVGYQLALARFRLRLAAFPEVNPAYVVLTSGALASRTGALGFGVGGQAALGYTFGAVQVFLDVRASYAPMTITASRVQSGGLVVGAGIWYEP